MGDTADTAQQLFVAYAISAADTATSGGAGDVVCGKPLSSLSTSQLATCLREFADQLASREGQPAG